jgi:hypothetical protein
MAVLDGPRTCIYMSNEAIDRGPPELQPASEPAQDGASIELSKLPGRTPLFEATHAARYHRQELIRQINQTTGTQLLCFIVGGHREIDRDDVLGFVDLLHAIREGDSVDLVLHTGGGDIDAAYKLVELIHARIGPNGRFRVVVPEYAKSAGTLMALGASVILMSDTSELGMIDPQYLLKDGNGNEHYISIVAYLEAYEQHSIAVNQNEGDRTSASMLAQFDPVLVRKFQCQRDHASDLAMRLLNRYGLNATAISSSLLSLTKWKTHEQVIGYADALEVGLNAVYIPPSDEHWQLYWRLHCLQRLEVKKDKKLFESISVSQLFED